MAIIDQQLHPYCLLIVILDSGGRNCINLISLFIHWLVGGWCTWIDSCSCRRRCSRWRYYCCCPCGMYWWGWFTYCLQFERMTRMHGENEWVNHDQMTLNLQMRHRTVDTWFRRRSHELSGRSTIVSEWQWLLHLAKATGRERSIDRMNGFMRNRLQFVEFTRHTWSPCLMIKLSFTTTCLGRCLYCWLIRTIIYVVFGIDGFNRCVVCSGGLFGLCLGKEPDKCNWRRKMYFMVVFLNHGGCVREYQV